VGPALELLLQRLDIKGESGDMDAGVDTDRDKLFDRCPRFTATRLFSIRHQHEDLRSGRIVEVVLDLLESRSAPDCG
jgi:hypothetical protein